MRMHQLNAAAIAETLVAHPAVRAVHYPGLATHPGHEIAARQQRGYGGMMSFEVADLEAAERCVEALTVFSLAESLGGVETLICHPGLMTHAAMPAALQRAAGISPGLLRVSVGIEQTDDLVADLVRALDRLL
jgi:cystathionine gamma-synthase